MKWCKADDPLTGPRARPVSIIGGHACCRDTDLCNKKINPVLWDYRKSGENPVLYDEKEGSMVLFYFFFFYPKNCVVFYCFPK